MLGISHLLEERGATTEKKDHFTQEVLSWGQIWRQMGWPPPRPWEVWLPRVLAARAEVSGRQISRLCYCTQM